MVANLPRRKYLRSLIDNHPTGEHIDLSFSRYYHLDLLGLRAFPSQALPYLPISPSPCHLRYLPYHADYNLKRGVPLTPVRTSFSVHFQVAVEQLTSLILNGSPCAGLFPPRFLMPEQTPEIVAAADVSPVSPKPIHTSAASPALVPSLQDHAAALDVAYLDSLTTAPFPFVAMPATPSADPATNTAEEPQTSLGSDSIVVQGDEHSDGSRNDDEAVDNGSVDAYGEDDDGQPGDENSPQPSHVHQVTIESGTGNENDAPAAQPDVAEASSESMINTPATTTSSPESSDLVKSESPAAVPPHSAEPDVAGASGAGLANAPDTNEHPEAEAASQAATDNSASGRDAALAAVPTHVQHQEESAGIDIKKLVDSISATADPSPSSATTAPQAPPDAAVSPVKPAGPFISLPQSSSLPPKPVLPQRMGQPGSRPEDFHPFPSRGGGSSQGTPLMSMQGVVPSQAAPNGSISHLAGATSEGVSSLPPIPQTSFNGGSDHYASLPNAMPASAAVAPQRDGLHGAQIQQAWETFQDDEKRYMTEAKWERFPDNSRIFIGECSTPQPLHALVTCVSSVTDRMYL